ncbi:glycosyltransferase [Nostoc sp. CHAB 5834]|nr:glycosyltransferase [Nostoc sp. CHAB 5834]
MDNSNHLLSKVTTIITTRNRISELIVTIEKCLKIGIDQHKIIIMDDCSTDGTSEYLSKNYPLIVLRCNSVPKGYIHNRNQMMKEVSSDFILSLDDDSNLLSVDDLVLALKVLESNTSYAVFSFGVEEKKQLSDGVVGNYEIKFYKSYIGCGHLIRKSVLGVVGYYREELIFYGEEADFSIRSYKHGYKVVGFNKVSIHHRVDMHERVKQVQDNKSSGEYGILWRSTMSSSNTLLRILMYYPLVLIPYYFIRTVCLLFYVYHIENNLYAAFWSGLRRFVKLIPYALRERNSLTMKEFRQWIRLPNYYVINN